MAEVLKGFKLECPETCPKEIYDLLLVLLSSEREDRPKFADIVIRLENLHASLRGPTVGKSVSRVHGMISRATSRDVSTFSDVTNGGSAASSSLAVLRDALLVDFRTAVTASEGHYRPGGYDRQVEKALAFAKYRLENAANADALACHNLNEDQIAAIHLYTQESPFYIALDGAMGGWGEGGRDSLVHYVPYIKLTLSGLHQLPSVSTTVYRVLQNIQMDTFLQGRVAGESITFSSFSTVSESPDIFDFAKPAEVAEVAEHHIVLKIKIASGVWIKAFSDLGTNVNDYHGYQQFIPAIEEPKKEVEDPILLLPGIQYKLDTIESFELGVTMVSLHEILPDLLCKYNCGFTTEALFHAALAEHESACEQFYMQPDSQPAQRSASIGSYLEPAIVGDDYEYGQDCRQHLANLANAVSVGAPSTASNVAEGAAPGSSLNNLDEDGYLESTNIPGGMLAAMQSNGFDSEGYSFPNGTAPDTAKTGSVFDAAPAHVEAEVVVAGADNLTFDPENRAMYFRASVSSVDTSVLEANHPTTDSNRPTTSLQPTPAAAQLEPTRSSDGGHTDRMSSSPTDTKGVHVVAHCDPQPSRIATQGHSRPTMPISIPGGPFPLNARGPKLRAHHKQGAKRPASAGGGRSFEQLKVDLTGAGIGVAKGGSSSTDPDYEMDPTKHTPAPTRANSMVAHQPPHAAPDTDYIVVNDSTDAAGTDSDYIVVNDVEELWHTSASGSWVTRGKSVRRHDSENETSM
jgi:hypothetical protein